MLKCPQILPHSFISFTFIYFTFFIWFIISLLQLSPPGLSNHLYPLHRTPQKHLFQHFGRSPETGSPAGKKHRWVWVPCTCCGLSILIPSRQWADRDSDTRYPELLIKAMTAIYISAQPSQIVFLLMAMKHFRSHAKALGKELLATTAESCLIRNNIPVQPRFWKSQWQGVDQQHVLMPFLEEEGSLSQVTFWIRKSSSSNEHLCPAPHVTEPVVSTFRGSSLSPHRSSAVPVPATATCQARNRGTERWTTQQRFPACQCGGGVMLELRQSGSHSLPHTGLHPSL